MPIRKFLTVLCAAAVVSMAADQEQPTPYDLIRPVFPLTWDSTVFDKYDTTVTKKHNMVPKNRTPQAYVPNALIPDTLNQAYLDAINVRMSPIRVNQAGYLADDPECQFYYIGTASNFEVVDIDGKSLSPAVTGPLTSSGKTTSSDWTIIAGTNAATNDQKRYKVSITGQSGTIMIGNIPSGQLEQNVRYRIKVGNDISSTFIISDRVYSMVKAAALKFYGINRSGNGESWFHPASHTLDGAGPVVTGADDARGQYDPTLAGTLEGGYYDCGDHLKESQTQMYAFMVSAVMAATNPDADEDNYAYNQGETVNTDGIPDMLREAKHGADFVLRSYKRAKGVIDDMALSVGNFGADHGWWGRPENQDKLPIDNSAAATDRGGPATRTVRLGEIGANIGGQTAAGLAILAKDYAQYDADFADSCLMVAEAMYDFAKSMAQGKTYKNNTKAAGWSSPAYNGNNEFYDDMALASVALLYATGKKQYADDMIRTKNLVAGQEYMDGPGFFTGGWFVTNNKGFFKDVKNTSWANSYSYALYALYKLILADENKAINEYGLTEAERLNAIEDCIVDMIANLGDMGNYGGGTIALPNPNNSWKPSSVTFDPIWYSMTTDQTWIYNRYQAGNIFEVLAYADVANDIQKQGLSLPAMGNPDWKAAEMKQLAINQLNYMLGVNPWDVSFILGVGDKNDAHPHHRAANPEGKNVPGAGYKYNPPTGALFGGVKPGDANSWVPDNMSWEDYHLSETCIDAAATLVSSGMLASQEIDRTLAPKISVEIRHVSMDSAIVMVKLTTRGTTNLAYGTSDKLSDMTEIAVPDNNSAAVQHEIVLRNLQAGTTYYFVANAFNAYKKENSTTRYMVDSTQTPFSFTTLNTVVNAEITNITVCNLTGDSAEIMWYTPNGEYESKLYWDTIPHTNPSEFAWNTGARNADVSGIPTRFHYVKIGGLKEQTTYYYMVESNGVSTNVNEAGEILKFTTPVGWYDFSVRAYQYEFSGTEFLNLNIYNNEARAFDSLTLRMYFSALPEEVEKCATLIDSDICQAYDEAGFNKVCETDGEIRALMRSALPVRLDDTYDAATGKYAYYFPVPLGSTTIKSSSRVRIDLTFSSGLSNDGYKTCETLRTKAKKLMNKNSGDWSWMPHDWLRDGADYDGMPYEDKDYGDIDNEIPINQYIVVYRKNEFIWGFSPSYKEMTTKRAHYEMDVTFDEPFNVSNGSYVEIDQTSSTVYVTGHAHITEGGFITRIWANGQEVNDPLAAVYNETTDLWDLKIPVKMSIGSNKVDITLFAGPDPTCSACTENGGCAFVNRSYFVQFTKGNATAAQLTIKDANDKAILSPAAPDSTNFYIYLTDKDKAGKSDQVSVKVINTKKSDTLTVVLKEQTKGSGMFRSENMISAVAIAKESRGQNQISFFAGDTIHVIYIDPDDDEDIAEQTFYSESNYPAPQSVLAVDTDCDNKADLLKITFTNNLGDGFTFDKIRFFIEGMADTAMLPITQETEGKSEISISIKEFNLPENAAPTGKATIYLGYQGAVSEESINITDGIPPQLMSVTMLENPEPRSDEDTVMVAFTEPVLFATLSEWPLEVSGVTGTLNVVGKPTTTNDGRSWQFVLTGNTKGALLPVNAVIHLKNNAIITDQALNLMDPNAACTQVKIAETPKPVPVKFAEMRDLEGDGYPDELFMVFEKKLRKKDMLDSFVVDWGMKSIVKSFITKSDTSNGIQPVEDFWSLRDSISAPYEKRLDSVNTVMAQDTFSLLTIKITPAMGYPLGATSGPNDGYGSVTPRLGPIGGFFDRSYAVTDHCPPIIMKAKKATSGAYEILDVTMSEPLTTIDNEALKYIERKRGSSTKVYLDPKTVANSEDASVRFAYTEESEGAVRIGDFIRLIPIETLSRFKDKAGNYATEQNPWVKVNGAAAEKTKFTVTLDQKLTTPSTLVTPYIGAPLANGEQFRITVQNENGTETLMNLNGETLVSTSILLDTAIYKHAGPVFLIDISLPAAQTTDKNGNYAFDFQIRFDVMLFDNMGQYINKKSIRIPLADVGYDKINEDGVLHLKLEWVAEDGVAPVSETGKKLGTGVYIAKFDFSSIATYVSDEEQSSDEEMSYKKGDKIKTKDNKTKTFGFKRTLKK